MKINLKRIKKESLPPIIFLVVCVLVGMSYGYIINDKLGGDLSFPMLILRLLEAMAMFFIVMFVHIIIHEIGHLIAGLMRGYRFLSFMILNIMITRKDGKFHFSRFGIPGAGGQCLMVPPTSGDSDAGIAFYNAGGVIINALVGIITGTILALFYSEMSFEVVSLLLSFAIIGVFFALTNGIPTTMGGIPNDGKNMLELKKDRFSTEVFLKSMQVVAAMQEGNDIESVMPSYMCDDREIDFNNPIHVMALNLDLSAAMSRMDLKKACDIIDRAMPHAHEMVAIYRYEFKMEGAFLAAVLKEYAHDASTVFDKDLINYMQKMSVMRPDVLRMQYGIVRMYEHNEKKATEIYDRFVKMCNSYHSISDVRYQTQLIEMVRKMPMS